MTDIGDNRKLDVPRRRNHSQKKKPNCMPLKMYAFHRRVRRKLAVQTTCIAQKAVTYEVVAAAVAGTIWACWETGVFSASVSGAEDPSCRFTAPPPPLTYTSASTLPSFEPP